MICEPVNGEEKKRTFPFSMVLTLIREAACPYEIFQTHNRSQKRLFEKAEYSQKMDNQTVMTIWGHSRGAAAHTALLLEEKQGTAVFWANGPNTGSLSVADA